MTSWHADLGPRDDAVEKGRQCMLLQQLATSTPSRDALDGLQVASVRGAKLHTEERPGVGMGLEGHAGLEQGCSPMQANLG